MWFYAFGCLLRVGQGRNLEVCHHGIVHKAVRRIVLHFTQDANESSDTFTSLIVNKLLFG